MLKYPHARRTAAICALAVFSCSKPEPDNNTSLVLPSSRSAAPTVMAAPPAPEGYATVALQSPRIVVLGDSIMHYSDELVSRRVQEVISSDAGAVSVKGVTKGGQLINGWIGSQFDRYVTDPDNNIIVLQGGVNDIGWYGKTGHTATRDEAFDKLIKRFGDMVQKAIDNRKVIVLVTVTPWKGQPHWNAVGQENSEKLNSWMKEQARRPGVYLADTYSALVTKDPGCESEKDTLARGYRGVDVQHTNDAGRKVIGEVIAQSLGFPVPSFTAPEKTKANDPCK
ncbi:MAG: SGNH/GDSL hydrolase family protein [Candidatus Micrarchaeia archaeon]